MNPVILMEYTLVQLPQNKCAVVDVFGGHATRKEVIRKFLIILWIEASPSIVDWFISS